MTQRLKPILIQLISKEQFRFLQHRQIRDAMALAQEALHSIKLSKQEAMILKINLSKAYYRVNWTYFHLILLQLGINLNTLNWIMGCVQSVSFLDLINGTPSNFFCALQGLRQGCPLSPFLFLLVAYGLSKLIVGVKSKGELIGIKISQSETLSHLLFVDDILLFVAGSLLDIRSLKHILSLYEKSTRMVINSQKSCLISNMLPDGLLMS